MRRETQISALSFTLTWPLAACTMFYTQKIALLTALGACLSACSPSGPATTESPAAPVKAAAAARTVGTSADSLNGLPGRLFGTPLTSPQFAGLVKGEGSTAEYANYFFPKAHKNQQAWFARHEAEVPGVFYNFRDGKFAQFQAVAYSPAGQAALTEEASFLFGPGRVLGDRVEWAGERVTAILSTTFVAGHQAKVLAITSTQLEAAGAKDRQAKLRAENAGH